MLGRVRVSIIHRKLIWTTVTLVCVRDHSYACVCIYTRGVGHGYRQRVSTTFLRIVNVRTCSFLYVLMYIHTAVAWAHQQRVSTIFFDSDKLFSNCLVLLTQTGGSNLGSLDLESDAPPTEPPRHPVTPSPPKQLRNHANRSL